MKSAIIIPARLESTRLPRKMLLSETGKSLIQHTYEAARCSTKTTDVVVATDSEEIRSVVERFGGRALLTDPDHSCGTDRVAEAASELEADIILNVQGDEPELSAGDIDLAIELLEQNLDTPMATLAVPIRCKKDLLDPNCVKVVLDNLGNALYFSRSPIPYARDGFEEWGVSNDASNSQNFLQHLGIYAYRKEFLLKLTQLQKCDLESIESLEQLRVLAHGYSIKVGIVQSATPGIDTPEDYQSFVRRTLKC